MEHRKEHGYHKHEVYPDTFTSHVSNAVKQLIRQALSFEQIWEPEVLELPSEITESGSKENRHWKLLHHSRQATRVVLFSSVNLVLQLFKDSGSQST